jgi:hypothetical protein
MVSVAITSFNSEKWLARALDSVLEQRAPFPIEIVVGDDCSLDGTVGVAMSYRDRHPDMIKVIARSKNIGIQQNYYDTFTHCRGKYIAWLDADDYWTDPEKLQVQIQMMEDDPTISASGHVVRWVTTEREFIRMHPSSPPGRYGLGEMVRRNFLPSVSVVFRNGIQAKLPEWYFDLKPVTDWPIWILAAQSGDIVLLERVMADYTLTPGSAFMGTGRLKGSMADARFYEKVESILPQTYRRIARAEKGKRYEEISYLLRQDGDFSASLDAAQKAFSSPAALDNIGSKTKTLVASLVRQLQSKFTNKSSAQVK